MLLRPQQVFGIFSGGPGLHVPEWDDFDSGGSNAGAASIPTATTFGKLNWRCLLTNSGTLQYVQTDVDATTHGVIQLETVTNAASTSGFGRSVSGPVNHRVLGSGQRHRVQWQHRNISALSNGTDRYTLHAGWFNTLSATPADGVYFTYSDNINSGNWRGVAMKAGVPTNVDSAIAVAVNTKFNLEWTWNTTTLEFFVNQLSIGTVAAANVPTNPISESVSMIRNAGTASRLWRLDWYGHDLQWGSGRF